MAHHIGLFMCLKKKGSRSKEKHENRELKSQN